MLDHRWQQQASIIIKAVRWRKTPPWPGFGQPFNGQVYRLRTVRNLIAAFSPDAFVETGTFLGHTTQFFSGNGVPVFTVELKLPMYLASRLRLAFANDVNIIKRNSSDAIMELARRHPFERPLAYLDAHWWKDLPLPEEVDSILSAWREAIIVIDDFQVPGDDGYGFDRFGGRPLAIEMLRLPYGAIAAYPSVPADQETGGRRGTLYIAWGTEATSALMSQVDAGLLRLAQFDPRPNMRR